MSLERTSITSLSNNEKLKEFLKQVAISAAMTAIPDSVQFIAEVSRKAYELWFASPSAERASYLLGLDQLSEAERGALSAEVESYTGVAEPAIFEVLQSIQVSRGVSVDGALSELSTTARLERHSQDSRAYESVSRSRQRLFSTLLGLSKRPDPLGEPERSPKIPNFEIIRILGRGADSVVYLARQMSERGRPCAVKVGRLESPLRFKRELKALKAVSHENLIDLWGSGVLSDNPSQYWIAMPNTGGATLATLWRRGEVERVENLRLMGEVLSGLVALHRKGIIHRDLKPANVLITPDLTARVADFGLSKSAMGSNEASMTLTDEGLKGTPAYMSPEQINQARRAGLEIDVWGFGVMLYEALRGSRPFQGQNMMVLGKEVLTKELDFTGDWLPSELSDVLRRCLARDPAQRYESALQLERPYQEAVEAIFAQADKSDLTPTRARFTSPSLKSRVREIPSRSSPKLTSDQRSFDPRSLVQLIDVELRALRERAEERDRVPIQSMIAAGRAFKGRLSLSDDRVYYEYQSGKDQRGPRHDYQYMLVKVEGRQARFYQELLQSSRNMQLCRTTRRSGQNRAGVELVGVDLALVADQAEAYLLPPLEDFVLLENLKAMLMSKTFTPKLLSTALLRGNRADRPEERTNIQYHEIRQRSTVVIGPPGCGKTYTIANIIVEALRERRRVLVCAFTNAALSALCAQEALGRLMRSGRVKKSALSQDERDRFPHLASPSSSMIALGDVHLMTVYKLSQVWREYVNQVDLVILDEAGQVLLPVFEMIAQLNVPFLAVGDDRQLSAVMLAKYTNAIGDSFVNGFKTLVRSSTELKKLGLKVTYRLAERATSYTSLFYDTPLISHVQSSFQVELLGRQLKGDGPVLVLIDDGDQSATAQRILSSLPRSKSTGILSTSELATQELQATITTSDVFIDTVYRSQGHTFDYVIFSMPQATENDLQGDLFNVATSRAREFTFILMKHGRRFNQAQSSVRQYLTRLSQERAYVLNLTSSRSMSIAERSAEGTSSATRKLSSSSQRAVESRSTTGAPPSAQGQLKKLPYTFKRRKT